MEPKGHNMVLSVNELIPRDYSLKFHTKESKKLLKNSLSKNGQTRPIIVRTQRVGEEVNFHVVDGDLLLTSAKSLKWTDVRCLNVGEVNEIEALKIYLLHNVEYYEKDYMVFSGLVAKLKELGMSVDKLSKILSMKKESVELLHRLVEFDLGDFDEQPEGEQLGLF